MMHRLASASDNVFELAKRGSMTLLDLFEHASRLSNEGKNEQSIILYRLWLENTSSPAAYAVYFNLGVSLTHAGDDSAAEKAYRQAIALKFDFNPARFNLGTVLERLGQFDDALEQWRLILQYANLSLPDDKGLYIQALNNLGRLLEHTKRLQEAEQMLTRSLKQNPDQPDVISHWVHLRQKQCEWPIYDTQIGVSEADLQRSTSALAMLSASDDPTLQLATARNFVESKVVSSVESLSNRQGYGHDKLRIGYLSSDLCMHAVSILTAELYELHDRSKVEVYGFCWSPEDGSAMRARILKAMDHYVRIKEMTDEEAAKCIRSHEIDILVDLQGLTSGTRPNILAYRPAPVQISYLGFPGTTALPTVDYVIADRYVLPESLMPFFTEKPLYMPSCFQINDRQRTIGVRPSRVDCSLPEDAFVYCSFNNNFKFTPEVFGCWMRILRRTPGSVLWLLADNEWAHNNLCLVAKQYGIDEGRLRFAPRVSPENYLARYQVADLFLDTFPFNAGTTASDALWAGLPLLTYSGRTFASRMAGSLLNAVGLPELIATDLQDYEDKAVALAQNPDRIAMMKQHLANERLRCPLFDTPKFVRDLEELFYNLVAHEGSTQNKFAVSADVSSTSSREEARFAVDNAILPHLTAPDPGQVVNFSTQTAWGLRDSDRFYSLMAQALECVEPGYYLGEQVFTWGQNNSLFDDADFRRSWEGNAKNTIDRNNAWGCYITICAAYHCIQLQGDFVFCGVGNGSAIKSIIDYFGVSNFKKPFWAYDNGFGDGRGSIAAVDDNSFDLIQARFAEYPQVNLVKGRLPEVLRNDSPKSICCLCLDMFGLDELPILECLFEKVVPGGLVILGSHEKGALFKSQKVAKDKWFDERGYRVFPLPTGQGLILKR
jgi:predicted O-linked N-acetylglucosamine transferase (SPINDLY family)